jgi:hypothetical protein
MRLNIAWSASLGVRQYPIRGDLGQGGRAFLRGDRMNRMTPVRTNGPRIYRRVARYALPCLYVTPS